MNLLSITSFILQENTLKSTEVKNWVNSESIENSWATSFSLYARIIAE